MRNEKKIKKAYYTNTLHNYRTVCPFINNGSCMIYEFRPTNCRTHFSTDIKLCQKGKSDMNFFKTPKVHSLINMTFSETKEENPKKGFLHNAFIFDGNEILVDPLFIFEDNTHKRKNPMNLSGLINKS